MTDSNLETSSTSSAKEETPLLSKIITGTLLVALAICVAFFNRGSVNPSVNTPTQQAPWQPPKDPAVVIMFTAEWCGPCKAYKPTLEALKAQGYKVFFIDVDKYKAISQQMEVGAIPTTIIFSHGREYARAEGPQTRETILKLYEEAKNLDTKNPPPEDDTDDSGLEVEKQPLNYRII